MRQQPRKNNHPALMLMLGIATGFILMEVFDIPGDKIGKMLTLDASSLQLFSMVFKAASIAIILLALYWIAKIRRRNR